MTATLMDQWTRLSKFRDGIEAALQYGGNTHNFTHIVEAVEDGRMQAWCGEESVVITELIDNPTGRRDLHFYLASGNEAELRALQPTILEWGRYKGCECATIIGRLGWARSWLTKEGWKPALIVMTKQLEK